MIETLATFSGLAGALKSASDIVKVIAEAKDGAVIRAKVAELQTQILSAQSSALSANTDQFALLEEVRSLKKEIADLEAWDTEKKRYQLQEIRPGAFAYQLKPECEDGEPPHQICATCYQERRRIILRLEQLSAYHSRILVCSNCSTVIYVSGQASASHKDEIAFFRRR